MDPSQSAAKSMFWKRTMDIVENWPELLHLFPSSELKFGMKGFDHTLNPPTFWGDSWVPGRLLVPGTWSEPW